MTQIKTDLDFMRDWERRITAWIDRSNERLKKLIDLPQDDQDDELRDVLVNPHVSMIYRPSLDELSALIHLGVKCPVATQEMQGYLKHADNWYDRLMEGPQAGENLMNAIWELRDSIRAVFKGIEQDEEIIDREPVSELAGLILDKLRTLQEHQGMNTNALLDWLGEEHSTYISDGTLRKHIKELYPYGLKNKPKIGYYVR